MDLHNMTKPPDVIVLGGQGQSKSQPTHLSPMEMFPAPEEVGHKETLNLIDKSLMKTGYGGGWWCVLKSIF